MSWLHFSDSILRKLIWFISSASSHLRSEVKDRDRHPSHSIIALNNVILAKRAGCIQPEPFDDASWMEMMVARKGMEFCSIFIWCEAYTAFLEQMGSQTPHKLIKIMCFKLTRRIYHPWRGMPTRRWIGVVFGVLNTFSQVTHCDRNQESQLTGKYSYSNLMFSG